MLQDKKLFLFDIDGCLAVGDTLFEGSRRLLSLIGDIGGKSYFITNNSTKSGRDYVKKFRDSFGLAAAEDQFVTSGFMAVRFLKENYAGRKIFVMGTRSFLTDLWLSGLNVTETAEEDIACVLAAYDSELTYEKLVRTCRVLSRPDMPFYATNPDLCCPADFGFIPDCGAMCGMLSASTGKTPVYLGKPSREVVDLCLCASGFAPEQTLVVGDRLYTDILCGINAGVDTCVLYTGEATPEEVARSDYKPTFAFDNVQKLYEAFRLALDTQLPPENSR